jgi:hypothetical protein
VNGISLNPRALLTLAGGNHFCAREDVFSNFIGKDSNFSNGERSRTHEATTKSPPPWNRPWLRMIPRGMFGYSATAP